MIGRAARGNPWLFREASALLEGSPPPSPPQPGEIFQVAGDHMLLHRETYGDRKLKDMASQLCWYVRGYPRASQVRARLFAAGSYEELESVVSGLAASCTQ
jgi:tRNA-dihydrouridine synthase B